MSAFSTLNEPIGQRTRYQSASTTQLYQSIPSLMINDQMLHPMNNTLQRPETVSGQRNIHSISSNTYQNIPNSNNASIRRIKHNLVKTLPRSVYSNATLSRSFDDLSTIRTNTINRRSVALDNISTNADPELKNVKKTGASYHVSVDLKANLLRNIRPRPATAMQMRNNSRQTTINRRSMITNQQQLTNSENQKLTRPTSFIQDGNRTSIVNLTTLNNNSLPSENLAVRQKSTNFPSKAIINLNAPKNNASVGTQISNKENSFSLGGGYIIKSLKPSDIKREVRSQQILKNNNVDFDLCLYGTMVKQPESSITLNSQIVDIKPSSTAQFEQTTQSRSTARTINEIDEPDIKEKPLKKKSEPKSRKARMPINEIPEASAPVMAEEKPPIKKTATTSTAIGTINTDPTTLPKSLNTDPEKESKEIQTLSTKNKLIQTDYFSDPEEYVGPDEIPKKTVAFVKNDGPLSSRKQTRSIPMEQPDPPKANVKSLPIEDEPSSEDEFDGYENNIPPSLLSNLQTNYDLSDEESIMYRRLMKNAPEGSLKQNINVEDKYVHLLGPYSDEQVREKYERKEINVDHVAQRVELTVINGLVTIKLQLTFQKTVPYKNAENTFKQTTLVVNKIIIVDLTVTDERRQIYQEVLQNHKNGRLDKVYTWKLYKIFSAMALADKGMGLDKEHVSIEKKVEEDKKLNLNGTDLLDYQISDVSFKDLDKKAAEMGINEMYGANFDETMRSFSQSGIDGEDEHFVRSRSYAWDDSTFNNSNINKVESNNDYAGNDYYHRDENFADINNNRFKANYNIRTEGDKNMANEHSYEFSSNMHNFENGNSLNVQPRNLLIIDNSSRLNQVKSNISSMGNGLRSFNDTWKSSYGKWLSTDKSGARINRIGNRFDVYSYLRPGGTRNYNIQLDNKTYGSGLNDADWNMHFPNFQNDYSTFGKLNIGNQPAKNAAQWGTGSNEHQKRMASYKSSAVGSSGHSAEHLDSYLAFV